MSSYDREKQDEKMYDKNGHELSRCDVKISFNRDSDMWEVVEVETNFVVGSSRSITSLVNDFDQLK